MSNDHVAVLSDIHIGNDANTCWYQRRVHEPYLVAALEWVVRNAGMFREVILLGDLVDTWTYPPSVRPPSMADIIGANPKVLGSDGALAKVVKAVPKVTFMLGNHDGTLTKADITALQNAVGPVEPVDAVHVLTGTSGARSAFSHGHYWTMFNAPDDRSRWDTLPVGHFVTRAFSYMMANTLKDGQTVADLANMGYPNGFNVGQFLASLGPKMRPDLAALLLDYVASAAKMDEALTVVLPNGESTSIAQAKDIYADLFTRWVGKEKGNVGNAVRAALADDSGASLAWFAQRLAIQQSADLVVLGHTHTPVAGLAISPINYYNSGFECASVPDNPAKAFTFTVVDLETAAAEIMVVKPDTYAIAVAPVPAMPSVILSPFMDFSSYVRILNEGSEPVTLTDTSATEGYWAVPPPQTIPAGGRGDAWLQDHPGAQGSKGTFAYARGGTKLPFSVSCPAPLWEPNTASGAGGNFVTRSGAGDWGRRGGVLPAGHPLQVIFTVGGSEVATTRVVYRGEDAHVYELFIGEGGWELFDRAKRSHAPLAAGDPVGFHSGTARVVYRGQDGHIHELFVGQRGWELLDHTKHNNAPLAAGDPMGFHSGTARVVYRGEDGHIYELFLNARRRWDLFDHSKHNDAPLAAGDPMGFDSGTARVVYRGQDGHIYEFFLDAQRGWQLFDHTKHNNAPAAAGDPMGFHSGTARVVYRGQDGHVYEFFAGPSGWDLFDHTKHNNAPLAASDPTGFHSETARVVYRGQDGHVYEFFIGPSGWDLFDHTKHNNAPPAAGNPTGFEAPMTKPWAPTTALAHAVHAAGFLYDPDQDIMYSRKDALQRNLGYAYGYDAAAFLISADIDCEPIFFDYDGKHWMIELWKGQYGLMTGCEIGVYTRPIGSTGVGYALLDATVGRRPGDDVPSHNLFYDCAADADMLQLSATLRRDGEVLFTRGTELHWWLTGFKWGVLSDPSQLSVDVTIRLKDEAMCKAFMAGIAGRPYSNLNVAGTTVSFTFDRPHAVPQPPKPDAAFAAVRAANRAIVSTYAALGFPNNDPNVVQADFLSVAGLALLHLADHIGRVVCQLAVEIGKAFASVVTALVDAFGVAASTIEGWLSGVAQAFAAWVDEIERYLGLPLDFACYVEIDNTKGKADLLLTGSAATYGTYVVGPPSRVPQGTVARLLLKDPKPAPFGSEGNVTYRYADASLNMKNVVFSYECPFVGWNANKAASSQADWVCFAKSTDRNSGWSASVPPGGHPLFVGYVTGGGQPS